MCAELPADDELSPKRSFKADKKDKGTKRGMLERLHLKSTSSPTKDSKKAPKEPTDYGFNIIKGIMADVERRGISEEGPLSHLI